MYLQSSNRCFSSFRDRLISATEQLRCELHKSTVLLIVNTLVVVKAESICSKTIKINKTMETKLSH